MPVVPPFQTVHDLGVVCKAAKPHWYNIMTSECTFQALLFFAQMHRAESCMAGIKPSTGPGDVLYVTSIGCTSSCLPLILKLAACK